MNMYESQTSIDISGTDFPKVNNESGSHQERFWYVRDEFIRHSHRLLNDGKMFSHISSHLVGNRWECVGTPISISDVASFVWSLRLFYLKSENMSIFTICNYMERQVNNTYVKQFYKYMRDSWEDHLNQDVRLVCRDDYSGLIKTNKNLIDTLLYSGNFHSQEKFKKRFDELSEYMDESLIFMNTYNALHSSYQMNQISRSLSDLSESNMIIQLPNHLQHEWKDKCSDEVIT